MTHQTEHQITMSAPAGVIYDLIANVGNWPWVFPPAVHVDYVEQNGSDERIRIWATANGEVKGWTSRRTLDRDRLRIDFRQEVSQKPVAAMGGHWVIEQVSDELARVRLAHDFQAVGNDPKSVSWILQAIDRNSDAELAALKTAAEQRGRDELLLSFEDTVQLDDGSAKDVYDFIYDAEQWQQRLPHVARVALTEDTPNVQTLEMDTRTAEGSVHTTKSIRVCFPDHRIAYKQVRPPALMSVHTGLWSVDDEPGRTAVTSEHTVVLNRQAITAVLGEQATVADARAFVRDALGRNSLATMRHAKAYASAGRRG